MEKITVFLILSFWSALGLCQSRLIEGEVLDSLSRRPLPGVTLNYGQLSTKTDGRGKFSFESKAGMKQIIFNHIGYQTITRDISEDNSVILLSRSELELEEIVVSTGYQTFDKSTSTGSYVSVSGEQIANLPQEDFLSRMDGFSSGLLLNRPANGNEQNNMFTVRGLSTLGGVSMSRPLIVLDGFPYEGDLNAINPNDIENISILKDASASAIWGVRAGNGVVVVTTKAGSRRSKLKVEVNTLTTLTEQPRIKSVPRISSSDYIELEKFLYENGRYTTFLNNTTNRPAITPVVELLYQHGQGNITDNDLETELGRLEQVDIYDQLTDHVYRNMVKQQTSANISWGGDIASNYFSLG